MTNLYNEYIRDGTFDVERFTNKLEQLNGKNQFSITLSLLAGVPSQYQCYELRFFDAVTRCHQAVIGDLGLNAEVNTDKLDSALSLLEDLAPEGMSDRHWHERLAWAQHVRGEEKEALWHVSLWLNLIAPNQYGSMIELLEDVDPATSETAPLFLDIVRRLPPSLISDALLTRLAMATHVWAQTTKAHDRMFERQLTQALEYLVRASVKSDQNESWLTAMVTVLMDLGESEQALHFAERRAKAFPGDEATLMLDEVRDACELDKEEQLVSTYQPLLGPKKAFDPQHHLLGNLREHYPFTFCESIKEAFDNVIDVLEHGEHRRDVLLTHFDWLNTQINRACERMLQDYKLVLTTLARRPLLASIRHLQQWFALPLTEEELLRNRLW